MTIFEPIISTAGNLLGNLVRSILPFKKGTSNAKPKKAPSKAVLVKRAKAIVKSAVTKAVRKVRKAKK